MKLLVMSDLHLEYAAIDLTREACDLVVLAGDIDVSIRGVEWAISQFPETPVLYVPGNHEYYFGEVGATLTEMKTAAAGSNVRVLEKETVSFGDVRFIGATLWTDFKLFSGTDEYETMWSKVDARRGVPDYDGRIRVKNSDGEKPVSPDHTQKWHDDALAWLSSELSRPFDRTTVVLTHHAPSLRSVAPEYAKNKVTPAYASHLDQLVAMSDHWIHGHTHSFSDYLIEKCRVVCNPRGYETENQSFQPSFIVNLSGATV